MGFPPYEVVGTSIPATMGWGGPKFIIDVLLWPKYPTWYFLEKGWLYMGRGDP
jgi:hypothetical protein